MTDEFNLSFSKLPIRQVTNGKQFIQQFGISKLPIRQVTVA